MATDYIKKLPQPPHDELMKLAKKKGLLGEKLIFAEETVENTVSGEKIHQVRCFCSNCKTEFIASPALNGCGYAYYTSGFVYNGKKYAYYDKTECPHCSAPVKISNTRYYRDNSVRDGVYIQGYEIIDGNFAVVTWRLEQTVSMDKRTTEYTSDVREAFIFEKNRCFTLANENRYYGDTPVKIVQRRQFYPPNYNAVYRLPLTEKMLEGSTMENSRLDKVLKSLPPEYTVQYLRFYQSYSAVETLVDIGAWPIIEDEFKTGKYTKAADILDELNWTQKSPYKILGTDRNELGALKKQKLSYRDFLKIRQLRAAGVAITEENVKFLMLIGLNEALEIARYNDPVIKTAKYLQKQGKTYQYLKDYWNMAGKLGLDMENPIIKYPKNLVEKHDDLVMKIKWNEDEKLKATFHTLADMLEEESYNDGDMLLRPARSEKELIVEGKLLKHCVGGYGKSHCNGKSIFFIRKAEEPEKPWYTLQVDLKKGEQLQLHGYENDKNNPVPQKVKDFVTYWLENIFRPFDVKTMEFIEPKAAAMPAATA